MRVRDDDPPVIGGYGRRRKGGTDCHGDDTLSHEDDETQDSEMEVLKRNTRKANGCMFVICMTQTGK
jgi:hypothetical protein